MEKKDACLPIPVELFFVPKETWEWEVAGISTCSPVAKKYTGLEISIKNQAQVTLFECNQSIINKLLDMF